MKPEFEKYFQEKYPHFELVSIDQVGFSEMNLLLLEKFHYSLFIIFRLKN
jgi:hypothetical protein